MHVFHALAVPASAALLVGAFYLRRRRRVAWQVALALLCGLAALDIVKGLDVEEAALSAFGAALLWWGRDAFYVRGDPVRLRSAVWRVPAVVVATVLVGLASVAIAAPRAGFSVWFDETFQLLTWQPGELHLGDEGGHLPLALGLLGLVALGTVAWIVFRPLAAPRALPDPEVRHAVEDLVRRHGHDTLAFFKLRGDQHYLFADDGAAFLGYRVESGVMLCAGDPVGPSDAVPALLDKAAAFAQVRGLRLAAVAVSWGRRPRSRPSGCDASTWATRRSSRLPGSPSRAAPFGRCVSPSAGSRRPGTPSRWRAVGCGRRDGAPSSSASRRPGERASTSAASRWRSSGLVALSTRRSSRSPVRGGRRPRLPPLRPYLRARGGLALVHASRPGDAERPDRVSRRALDRSLPRARHRGGLAELRCLRAPAHRAGERARADGCQGAAPRRCLVPDREPLPLQRQVRPPLGAALRAYEGRLGLARAGLAAAWAEGQIPKPLARR